MTRVDHPIKNAVFLDRWTEFEKDIDEQNQVLLTRFSQMQIDTRKPSNNYHEK